MSKKIKIYGCPCCGSKAHWTKGNKDVRINDKVQCLECFLEMEGDYEPLSSVYSWNNRVQEYSVQDSIYNIDGTRIE